MIEHCNTVRVNYKLKHLSKPRSIWHGGENHWGRCWGVGKGGGTEEQRGIY